MKNSRILETIVFIILAWFLLQAVTGPSCEDRGGHVENIGGVESCEGAD
jgi:hypothetical protein